MTDTLIDSRLKGAGLDESIVQFATLSQTLDSTEEFKSIEADTTELAQVTLDIYEEVADLLNTVPGIDVSPIPIGNRLDPETEVWNSFDDYIASRYTSVIPVEVMLATDQYPLLVKVGKPHPDISKEDSFNKTVIVNSDIVPVQMTPITTVTKQEMMRSDITEKIPTYLKDADLPASVIKVLAFFYPEMRETSFYKAFGFLDDIAGMLLSSFNIYDFIPKVWDFDIDLPESFQKFSATLSKISDALGRVSSLANSVLNKLAKIRSLLCNLCAFNENDLEFELDILSSLIKFIKKIIGQIKGLLMGLINMLKSIIDKIKGLFTDECECWEKAKELYDKHFTEEEGAETAEGEQVGPLDALIEPAKEAYDDPQGAYNDSGVKIKLNHETEDAVDFAKNNDYFGDWSPI